MQYPNFYVVYDSFTGQTKKFAQELGFEHTLSIDEVDSIPAGSSILLCTRTFGFGKVPDTTKDFLRKAIKEKQCTIIGTAVSGNRNWGEALYGACGRILEEKAHIHNIVVFECSGYPSNRQTVIQFIENYFQKEKTL